MRMMEHQAAATKENKNSNQEDVEKAQIQTWERRQDEDVRNNGADHNHKSHERTILQVWRHNQETKIGRIHWVKINRRSSHNQDAEMG
jgi:hypothetical protein